ncbi:MAG: hypothetical protein DMD81_03120 [Candidatus Rokuibacteriota bacterium]|nr:MAG: hypothetical protein DMD81_03120 [Candidatus Rokubacteria bacterium]
MVRHVMKARLPSPRFAWCLLIVAATLGLALAGAHWRARQATDVGERLVVEGHYRRAIRTLSRAVALAPDEARAHFYLGIAYSRIGMPEGAMAHLREAVRLAPREPRYRETLDHATRDTAQDVCGDRCAESH